MLHRWWRRWKRFLPGSRRKHIAALVGLMVFAIFLLRLGQGIDKYPENVFINVGADLVGAIVTLFVITPIINRAGEGRVREHPWLDYEWYVERVAGATSAVRIMDTYSNLLDGPNTGPFFDAVELALERQANVQILLLDPDSSAARQRADELDDPDVYREIMRNLRELYRFHSKISAIAPRRRFNVRMYTASPSITVYRWDEKVLVSFFPVGKISSQSAQLEVTDSSPLGKFINERFNAVWDGSKDLGMFMRLRVTITEAAGADTDLDVEFIELDNRFYVGDSRMVARLARRRTGPALAHVQRDQRTRYELSLVDDDQPELLATLIAQFEEKYGHNHEVFVCFEPIVEDNVEYLTDHTGEEPRHP